MLGMSQIRLFHQLIITSLGPGYIQFSFLSLLCVYETSQLVHSLTHSLTHMLTVTCTSRYTR
jgi:hypothetical protein